MYCGHRINQSGRMCFMAYRLDVRKQIKGTYLIIQKKYWDKVKKQSRTKHHKSLGYLHDLQKQYPDPITHFKEIISQMNAEEKGNKKITLEIDMNEKLQNEMHSRYNMGYAAIMKIYHELELDRFLNNKARHENFEYNTDSIMKLFAASPVY